MSRPHRVEFAPPAADAVRSLPPEVKRQVRSALRAIAADPGIGVPLLRELEGLHKYRVRRFRIVYEIVSRARAVRVLAVGHRHSIYEEVAATRDRPRSH